MSDNESTDSSFGGLGKAWALSALLMVAVVLGLVFVLWPSGDADDEATDPSQTPTIPSGAQETIVPSNNAAPSSSKGWDDKGCNGTDGSEKVPTKAPSDVKWVPVAGQAVPVSDKFGPKDVASAPLRKCFQHSPTGAVFAAVNIPAAALAGGKAGSVVSREQMTPGQFRDEGMAASVSTDAGRASVAGFQLRACDPHRCLVDLVLDDVGTRAQLAVTLVWSGGDWKMDGSVEPAARLLDTPGLPTGFIPWMPGM